MKKKYRQKNKLLNISNNKLASKFETQVARKYFKIQSINQSSKTLQILLTIFSTVQKGYSSKFFLLYNIIEYL